MHLGWRGTLPYLTGIDLHKPHLTTTPFGGKRRGPWAAIALRTARLASICFVLSFLCIPFLLGSASTASAETRSLKIHFIHTGEKANIVFKRNGRYDPKGLQQLNMILRDWRRNEPTKMNPRLFDLVWEVYRRTGGSDYITVVSGYRSPATNSMLRSRSKGVAKESQHMEGTAMDFYIPGVSLARIREVAMKMQVGGVGYYPRSGSPFVHLDVAGVRSWPRMSRQELSSLFPDGKTVHLPSDGKPLPGYQQAMADYKRRLASPEASMMAESRSPGRQRNLLAMLFGGGDEDEEEDVGVPAERPAVQVASRPPAAAPAPAQRQQEILTAAAPPQPVFGATTPPPEMAVANIAAPVPLARPSVRTTADTSLATALYSPNRSAAEDALSQVASGSADGATPEGFADLHAMNVPVPTLLGPRGMRGDAQGEILTASAGPIPTGLETNVAVPVPASRPAVAEALLAAADGNEEIEADEIEQAILSPEAAEALEQSQNESIAASVAPAAVATAQAPAHVPAAKPPAPSQVAMLSAPKPSLKPTDFGDAFDAPKSAEAAAADPAMPAKGGRPTVTEAEKAHRAITGAPALTANMLSTWALNRDRFEDVGKSSKAPRIAGRSPGIDTTATYAIGFKGNGAPSVDAGRFGKPGQINR